MNNETNQCDFPRAAGWTLLLLAFLTPAASATEFHVSVAGDAKNDGSSLKPFKTISAAARVAQPGDVITVHAGTYRERVTPPRGGESDTRRIVYQAARGREGDHQGIGSDPRLEALSARGVESDLAEFLLRQIQPL